jgi:hypothetical protein
VKTPGAYVPHKPVKVFEQFGVTINAVPIHNHPIYRAYFKINPDTRRFISKKSSHHKYRVLEQLKKGERVFLDGKLLKKPPDQDCQTFLLQYGAWSLSVHGEASTDRQGHKRLRYVGSCSIAEE